MEHAEIFRSFTRRDNDCWSEYDHITTESLEKIPFIDPELFDEDIQVNIGNFWNTYRLYSPLRNRIDMPDTFYMIGEYLHIKNTLRKVLEYCAIHKNCDDPVRLPTRRFIPYSEFGGYLQTELDQKRQMFSYT
jgi:hypothetical protein